MIGYRGACRYLSPDFVDCFAMECDALRHVRDEMGPTNVKIMIPFVRTIADAEGVVALLAAHGLRRGENELQVIMMCELPSNAVIADAFMDHSRPGFASASSPAPPDLRRWTARNGAPRGRSGISVTPTTAPATITRGTSCDS
jgi:phosphoenolpyruvate synthase/pyruvate phosphate dikinase